MPARVPNATGNWSTASNWLTSSNTMTLHATTNIMVTTTSRFTATYTAPSTAESCVGVALYLHSRSASTPITVALQGNSVDLVSKTFAAGDVQVGAEGWFFFRFDTPYQYTTTTANFYRFRVVNNSATASTYLRADSAGTAYAFMAVGDVTAAVAATDDVFVLGDVGQGAKTVTFDRSDASTTCLSLTIGNNGVVSFSTSMNTQMWLGNNTTGTTQYLGTVHNGGALRLGTVANPIPAAYTAALVLDGNATSNAAGTNAIQVLAGTSAATHGELSIVGDPSYNSRSRTMEGYATGWYATTLASNAAIGATSIVLTDDLGLRAGGGDIIGISEADNQTAYQVSAHETRTVTSYNAATKTVTFSPALTVAHIAGAIINNVSRNASVRSANTARTGQIITNGTNTTPGQSMILRHALFESLNRVGNNQQNSAYNPLGNVDIVGCSIFNPNSVSSNGFFNLYMNRLINCTTIKAVLTTSSFPISHPENARPIEIIGCSTTWASPFLAGSGLLVRDCLISAFYWGNGVNYSRFVNCVGGDVATLFINGTGVEIYNCSVGTFGSILAGMNNTVLDNCQFRGAYSWLVDSGMNNTYRNCTFTNAPSIRQQNYIAATTVAGQRIVGIQNCSIPSTPSTFTIHLSGQTRRYTSATAPQAVFPLPSGANVANRIESINPICPTYPIIHEFKIPVSSGAQSVTVSIPVYLSGWGTNLPTSSELFVELFTPGATVPIVSTSVVTANDQWQYLTVSGVSTGQGHLIARVVLKKYVANAVMYVDWPLGMSTTNMDWYEGRPNEYLTPLVPTVHQASAALSASFSGMADGGIVMLGSAAMGAGSDGSAAAALVYGGQASLSGQSGGAASAEILAMYPVPDRPSVFSAPRPGGITFAAPRPTEGE